MNNIGLSNKSLIIMGFILLVLIIGYLIIDKIFAPIIKFSASFWIFSFNLETQNTNLVYFTISLFFVTIIFVSVFYIDRKYR